MVLKSARGNPLLCLGLQLSFFLLSRTLFSRENSEIAVRCVGSVFAAVVTHPPGERFVSVHFSSLFPPIALDYSGPNRSSMTSRIAELMIRAQIFGSRSTAIFGASSFEDLASRIARCRRIRFLTRFHPPWNPRGRFFSICIASLPFPNRPC
jgi:hypothetical protein